MTWNHRVVKRQDKDGMEWFGIHEAFYNSKGEITSYTEDPVEVVGESIKELAQTLKWMAEALSKPVIDDATMKFSKDDSE